MAILICSYGESSSRKTTAMGRAAQYMYKKTGKPGRAIYSDTGNWEVIRPQVEAGILEPWNISGEPELLMILHKAARGEWPTTLTNGLAQDRHPVLKGSPYPYGVAKMAATPDLGDKIGFYIWEGLTSTSELLMKYIRDYRIVVKAKEANSPWSAKDQDTGLDMKFCANTMADYGTVQGEVAGALLPELAALPVERVFITAHECATSEEEGGSKTPIRGPALVGQAATKTIGKSLGDMLHHEVFTKADPKNPQVLTTDVRVYYKPHPDPKFPNIYYFCKTRMTESRVEALEKKFPGGYFSPNQFDEFLEYYDSLLADSTTDMKKWKEDIDAARKEVK
jgi:hypothetical protein